MTRSRAHTYRHENFSITLRATQRKDAYNHTMVRYSFRRDGKIIMRGDDLGIPIGEDPEGPHAAGSLLAFASSEEIDGSTDAEHARLVKFRAEDAERLYDWQMELDGEAEGE